MSVRPEGRSKSEEPAFGFYYTPRLASGIARYIADNEEGPSEGKLDTSSSQPSSSPSLSTPASSSPSSSSPSSPSSSTTTRSPTSFTSIPSKPSTTLFQQQPIGTGASNKAYQQGVEAGSAMYQGVVQDLQTAIGHYESIIEQAVQKAREYPAVLPKEDEERLSKLDTVVSALKEATTMTGRPFGSGCNTEREQALKCFIKHKDDVVSCSPIVDKFMLCAEPPKVIAKK